jgi:hypothetical protein
VGRKKYKKECRLHIFSQKYKGGMEKDKKKNFAFAVPGHYYITFVI